jgi:hypothetical protein
VERRSGTLADQSTHRDPRQPQGAAALARFVPDPGRTALPAARGGCSCAGPYGHRLLAIDAARSHALRDEVGFGCDGIKPGWVRVNFNYFISDTVRDFLIDAVDLVAREGHRLLGDYRFDPRSGLWRHRSGPGTPPLRLTDVRYTAAGEMSAR